MKSLREQFEEEYVAVSVPAANKNGFSIRYKYFAPWYIWDLPQKELKVKKIKYVMLSIISFMLYLLVGIQNIELNCFRPVEALALFALCFHVWEIVGVFQFVFAKYQTTKTTYHNVNVSLKVSTLLRACMLFLTASSGIIFLIQTGFDLKSMSVILGYFICAHCALYIFFDYRKISFRTEKNNALENEKIIL